MIKATTIHHLTLETTDERTAHLANMLHNMHEWHSTGFITNDTFVRIHDILRANLGTENFLLVAMYNDNREESNEYRVGVVEFPEKSDGTIRTIIKGEHENEYLLLTEEEALIEANMVDGVFEKVVYLAGKQAENLRTLKETKETELAIEVTDFAYQFIEKIYGKELLRDNKMLVYYEHEKLKDIEDAVLVRITDKNTADKKEQN